MEESILLEIRRLCVHWLTHKLQYFLFFGNLSTPRKRYIRTYTYVFIFVRVTLLFHHPHPLLTPPFLTHGDPAICLASRFFIGANSFLPEDLCISSSFWPGIFFSLIFSYYYVPPTIYTEFYFIIVEFYTINIIVFSIPILYYSMMVVISPFILLLASVIPRQGSRFLIHLSVLFKSRSCQCVGIFL